LDRENVIAAPKLKVGSQVHTASRSERRTSIYQNYTSKTRTGRQYSVSKSKSWNITVIL